MPNNKLFIGDKEKIILGVKINDLTSQELFSSVEKFLQNSDFNLIFTPNPEICLKAEKDENYRKVLNGSSINIPDGVGLKLGAEILQQKLKNRITGVDLTSFLLKKCNENNLKVLLINKYRALSSNNEIINSFNENYPNIKIEIINTNAKQLDKLIVQVKKINPDIILCANGAPLQEIILDYLTKNITGPKIGIGVGGTIDFITGKQKRAPKWWREKGIEWFYRLLKQPKRISRITDATIKFPLKCFEWQQRIKVEFRSNVLAVIKKEDKYLIQNNKRFTEDHWQFPQGGVNKRERLKHAVKREISEELGIPIDELKIEKQLPLQHSYVWPRWAQLLKGYKGQSQKFFILEYLGRNNFKFDHSDEVQEIKWVNKHELIKYIHPKRQESLKKILPYI